MLSQEYAHGPGIDNPWADLEHDGAGVLVRYYHADLLGSIRLITDAAGDVIQAYDLGAARPGIRLWCFAPTGRRPRFGETTECLFPFPFQPFQYAAREDDPDSKLDYNRARYYNPRAGRCISPDPLGAAGGRTNRFLYVGNSPTRFKDPSGMIGMFALGVVVGLITYGAVVLTGLTLMAMGVPLGPLPEILMGAGAASITAGLALLALATISPAMLVLGAVLVGAGAGLFLGGLTLQLADINGFDQTVRNLAAGPIRMFRRWADRIRRMSEPDAFGPLDAAMIQGFQGILAPIYDPDLFGPYTPSFRPTCG